MSLPKFLLAICTGIVVLLFFQNCQKAKMSTKGGADGSSLTRVNETALDLPPEPGPTPTAAPTPGPGPTPTATPTPTPTPPPPPTPTPNPDPVCPTDNGDADSRSADDDSHDHSRHGHHKSNYGHELCDDASSDDNSGDDCKDPSHAEAGNREYICGISGPGQSTRLAITENEQLEAKHQGVKMLCMSRHACEQIAATAFPGAHSERRGYCKVDSNKNVKHVSDVHLQELVEKWLAEHPAP